MCQDKKIKTIQIRVTEKEKELIKEIRDKEPGFNLSTMLRRSILGYHKKLYPPLDEQ